MVVSNVWDNKSNSHAITETFVNKDLGTGKEASVRIEQSSGLSEDEIKRMQRDAEEHAAEDKHRRELAEARNHGEHLCYQLEKMMKENEDKLTDTDREPMTRAIQRVREACKGEDVSAIKSAVEDLEQASHAFSKSIYERAQAGQAQQQHYAAAGDNGNGPSQSADDAIDAEFEVKS